MDKPPPRRLTLADLAILVASSAVGMLILRTAHEARAELMSTPRVRPWSWTIGMEISPFILSTAAALIIAMSLRPLHRWSRLFRQPGLIACLVILTDLALSMNLVVGQSFISSWLNDTPGDFYTFDYFLGAGIHAGKDVALAWSVLALARAWRPEPSWIDRAGRGLGILSIVLWLATVLSL